MVGGATVRRLASEDCEVLTTTRQELDLHDQAAVATWIADNKPDVIVLAAATVGGIYANDSRPAEFIGNNLMIQTNVIHAAYRYGVAKLLFLGSACIYPKFADQPIAEESLLTGPLEPTNEWYAIAKIAGIKMCQAYRHQYGCDFISAQPCNLYGIGDNFHPEYSHVIPGLIRRFHEAKEAGLPEVLVWGTGTPLREFLNVDDLADAFVFLLRNFSDEVPINIGSGTELTIRAVAEKVAEVVGYEGALTFDASKPDGTPRKFLDTGRLRSLGWTPSHDLESGLRQAYAWFLRNVA